jgi:hypothetical protein
LLGPLPVHNEKLPKRPYFNVSFIKCVEFILWKFHLKTGELQIEGNKFCLKKCKRFGIKNLR